MQKQKLQDWPLAVAVAASSQRLNKSAQLLVRFPKLPVGLALSSRKLALSSGQVIQHFHSVKEKLANRGDFPVVLVEPLCNRRLPHFAAPGRTPSRIITQLKRDTALNS